MIMVKKEKVPSPLPPKRVQVDINIKTSSSQKRKTFKATDLSLGNLGAKEALRKLVSFSQPVTNDISWSTVDLKVKAEKAELASKEQVRVCMANNEDLLMRVAPLSKQKATKEAEHVTEITEVIPKVKGNAVVPVQEVKIELAEDVANAGSQNVAGWHEALAKLNGEPIYTNQDPTGQLKVGGREKEVKKVSGHGNQAIIYV